MQASRVSQELVRHFDDALQLGLSKHAEYSLAIGTPIAERFALLQAAQVAIARALSVADEAYYLCPAVAQHNWIVRHNRAQQALNTVLEQGRDIVAQLAHNTLEASRS